MESPADGVEGLGGLAIETHCLGRYSHYPPLQHLAQLLTLPDTSVGYHTQEIAGHEMEEVPTWDGGDGKTKVAG